MPLYGFKVIQKSDSHVLRKTRHSITEVARTLDEIETLSIYICMILGGDEMRIILSGGGSGGQVKETY